ncbi:GDSL esterase/lipase At2g03980-like [Henckelia pumila]|uniref:GDSL esterase/lipase At2g03980-like n=1 Tax=Henckelia pumila TaxID=405737 RepID=UPI003C6E0F80
MNRTLYNFLFQILITFLAFGLGRAEKSPSAVPALYVFGDSLFDSGNNNLLPTLAKANYPPYGMNFERKAATGRFTNGKTVVDFIAEFLGLPFPPPFVSLLEGSTGPGLNYASGSCGILPQTGDDLGKCLSLSDQIDLFAITVERNLPEYYKNQEELSNYLSKSLFAITIGSNDYLNYFVARYSSNTLINPRSITKSVGDIVSPQAYDSTTSPQSFAEILIHQLSLQLQVTRNYSLPMLLRNHESSSGYAFLIQIIKKIDKLLHFLIAEIVQVGSKEGGDVRARPSWVHSIHYQAIRTQWSLRREVESDGNHV